MSIIGAVSAAVLILPLILSCRGRSPVRNETVVHRQVLASENAGYSPVSTAEDLLSLSGRSGAYILADDIVLPEDFSPISNFSGILDGGFHTVTVVRRGQIDGDFGIFLDNHGEIRRINVKAFIDVTCENADAVGPLVAENNGTVSLCSAEGTVRVAVKGSSYTYIGGLVGHSQGDMSLCSSSASVSAEADDGIQVGGIAGGGFECTFSQCESSADVSAVGKRVCVGGVIGECDAVALSCSFFGSAKGRAETASGYPYGYFGGIAGYALDRMDGCKNSGIVSGTGGSGSTVYAGGIVGVIYGEMTGCENSEDVVCTGQRAVYAGGISGCVCEASSGLTSTGNVTVMGLPSVAYVGGLCGQSEEITASDSRATVNVSAVTAYVGGAAGEAKAVRDTSAAGTLKASAASLTVGGCFGISSSSGTYSIAAENCSFGGGIYCSCEFGEIVVGGVAGSSDASVTHCSFEGAITAYSSGGYIYAGGVMGYNNGLVLLSEATCTVGISMKTQNASGVIAAGGLVGGNYGHLSSSKASADITASGICRSQKPGSGAKISLFAGRNAGLTRLSGVITRCAESQARINARIISGGVSQPKINKD